MNPNMIQMNQIRMDDIMRQANRQRIANQLRSSRQTAPIWFRMMALIGRALVKVGEHMVSASEASAQNRRTVEHPAIRLA